MDIIFYKTISENIEVVKQLTNETTITGTLHENNKILQPQILVNTDVRDFNYCYIPQFNRYYYITGVTVSKKVLFIVNCEVDVLMSYASGIKNLTAIVERQEHRGNNYYDNGNFIHEVQKERQRYELENPFSNDGEFILLTARGK